MAGLAIIAYVIDLVGGRADRQAGLAARDRLRPRHPARADKCLRSQPRRLHRRGADRPDAFRLVIVVLLLTALVGAALTQVATALEDNHDARPKDRTFDEASAPRRFSSSPSPASDSPAVTIMPATRNADRRQSRAARAAAISDAADARSQKSSDGERINSRRCRRDCRSMHWRPALSIRARSMSFPTETCWWSRAMVRKRRSTDPRTWSPAGYSRSPAPRQRTPTASRCCETRW